MAEAVTLVLRGERERGHRKGSRIASAIKFLRSIPLGGGATTVVTDVAAAPDRVGDSSAATTGVNAARQAEADAAAAASQHAASEQTILPLPGGPFRHISSRGQREAAPFKEAILHADVMSGRFMFSRMKEYPSEVFSIIRYDAKVERELLRERQAAAANLLLAATQQDDSVPAWMKWKGRSYSALMHAEFGRCSVERDEGTGVAATAHPDRVEYDPLQLDDPSIDLQRQRIPYVGEGYVASILRFRNEKDEKNDINERFAQANVWLDAGDGQSLTLSKIRSLKRLALQIWWDNDWEVSTVALAAACFERLVYKRLVNKGNRKLAMSACLLLAYKMNEARDGEWPATAGDVLTQLEAVFRCPRKNIVKAEFPVFVNLDFSLQLPAAYTLPHMERLLRSRGGTLQEYIGAAAHREYIGARVGRRPSADDAGSDVE